MKTIVSYKVRIIGMNRIFQPTAHIYQKAVAFLVPVVNEHWDDISEISYTNAKMLEIEKLVHTTKNHKAVYEISAKKTRSFRSEMNLPYQTNIRRKEVT